MCLYRAYFNFKNNEVSEVIFKADVKKPVVLKITENNAVSCNPKLVVAH